VEAVISVSERDIANHSFNMIESFYESIPQGIIQIYIACILNDDLQLTTWTECKRTGFLVLFLLLLHRIEYLTYNLQGFGSFQLFHLF